MPSASSRKQVSSTASGRKAVVHIQQLTGASPGSVGFLDGGAYTDVPGLSNVPLTFRTWSPVEKFLAQQDYPGVTSRAYMRWRRGANVRVEMRVVYGSHIYRIAGTSNYDEANTDIILYLEEWRPTGTVR